MGNLVYNVAGLAEEDEKSIVHLDGHVVFQLLGGETSKKEIFHPRLGIFKKFFHLIHTFRW